MPEQPARILTVDDDAFLCESVSGYLEEQGYDTLDAQSGAEALARVREAPPDLVLLDIKMPKMSGIEVLAALTREAPEVPVVIISCTNDASDVVEVLKLGAVDYITKPISDLEILHHAVVRALERTRLIHENRRYREHLEEEVRAANSELINANRGLARKNAALEELMRTIRGDREELGRSIASNLDKTILPLLYTLEGGLTARQREITRRIASDLGRITSPFVDELSRRAASLSPVEVRVCNLIRQGLSVKEVSRIEQVSPSTVSTHRRSIRRKLGLTNRKVNLTTYLNEAFPAQ